MFSQKKQLLSGGQIIFNKLVKNNVNDVFLYSGGAIMGLIDCFYNQNKIQYYIHTHEQNLGHAATGYARTTNKPGICIVTSGPGITNMITPMLDAQNDSTPLIVFSGNVQLSAMGTNAFQEAPAVELTKNITKWSYCVKKVSELNEVLDEAFTISQDGKKGVVHIDLPKCILSDKMEYFNIDKTHYMSKMKLIKENELNEISNVINNSEKPVFYVGQGCNNYSTELTKLVEKSNIPITTTIHAMGCYDETKDLSLKFLGMHGSVYANKSIQESDCIIALGSRFDDRTTGNLNLYAPNAKKAFENKKGGIIHCNINNNEINNVVKTHYNINSDCGLFIKNITPKIEYKKRQPWLDQIKTWKHKYPFTYNQNENMYTQDVLIELNKQITRKNDIIFTTGVGNHQMMAAQFIDWKSPKTFISSGSLGVMGFGLPAAIGVAIGNPDKTVIDIDGDGSFLMTLSDMKTAVQYDLQNLKVIILNNKTLGMVDTWEKLFYDNRITATDNKFAPSFYDVAKSFGFKALQCNNKKDLYNTMRLFLKTPGPLLCEFNVNSTECFPLVAPGKALDNMILNKSQEQNIDKTIPPS